MYLGAELYTTPQRITNDILKIKLGHPTEGCLQNMRNFTQKWNCRLILKKLLRQKNSSNKYNKQETDKQNTLDEANRISSGIDRYGEEPEIPVKYDTKASKIIQDVGNVVTEFETSGNSSNYFEEEVENPVNESEIDEDTEQELQGNDEFNSDCGGIGEHAQMLQANDEHTGSLQENKEEVLLKQNDKLKMEILEDVVLKRPNKSHAEILKTIKEIIVYKKGNSSTDDVTTAKVFDHIKQINYGKDTILQANDKVNSNIIYFGEEIENAANKLGVDDKTEQVLQGNKEFKDDSHKIIELVQISQENNDHTKILNEIKQVDISKPNDKLKVKILEDTMVKCAVKSHTEILNSLKEIILFTNDKSSSKIDGIDDVTAQKLFGHNSTAYKHINNGKDTILQVNRKINRNAKGIHNIDPKNNERMAENISTRSRESQVTGKFNNEISEKALKFDNFKVPKEVAISKKKRIKKQQRRFVLTHVVGGHIIQESNFPFPIREPQNLNLKKIKVCQKNKPQSCNTKGTAPSIKVLEEKKVIREENKTETPDHTKANEDKRFIQVETLIEKTEEVANIKEGCGPEGKVVQEETVTEEPTPIEKTEEVANIKEGCRPEEKVVQEETVTEGPTPIEKTEEVANIKEDCVIEEKVIQEKTVTEEPTPTEVTVVKENCVAGEPALTEVKEDGEDPPASISSLLDVANGELNPFTSLKRSTVKSWTVEALSNHLLKCEWEETASLLQDNEIDGESLFMVTKTQLMIIGVNEEQADIISEFIQSGSPKGH